MNFNKLSKQIELREKQQKRLHRKIQFGKEAKAGNYRPCQCGSGESWVSCSANSQYCG